MLYELVIEIFSQLCYRMALYPYFLCFRIGSDYIFKRVYTLQEPIRARFFIVHPRGENIRLLRVVVEPLPYF